MTEHVVILGAGQAGVEFATKLRQHVEDVKITMVGDEPYRPYQRPPLSKKYVKGEMDADGLSLRGDDWYDAQDITCLTSARAQSVDLANRSITLMDERKIGWDRLVFATGARPRTLPAAVGGDLKNVFVIRSIADADQIRDKFKPGMRLLVIGGGYIGLEAAAVAAFMGLSVHLVEMAERILHRVASPETSNYFRKLHQDNGVTILEGVGIETLVGKDGKVVGAKLANGAELAIDFVIVGIGIVTNSEIAQTAGIDIDNGIAVNLRGETSTAGVYACGDCASFMFKGKRIRLESVQNAIDQATNTALNLAADLSANVSIAAGDYHPVPWFWSDQYETKLQIAGLNTGYDQVVLRPGAREGSHSLWYFGKGQFLAVDAINDGRAYMVGKRILELGKSITPDQAADAGMELKNLLK